MLRIAVNRFDWHQRPAAPAPQSTSDHEQTQRRLRAQQQELAIIGWASID